MMSIEFMNHLARQAARRSAREGKEPLSFSGLGHDAIRERIRQIPFIGKNRNDDPRTPRGWKRVDVEGPRNMACTDGYLFVDSSGFGRRGEGALSVEEFVDWLYKSGDGFGFGIVEAGQFQVVIAAYQKRGAR